MKAIVYRRYGSPDVLRLEEVPKPAPGAGEVLVEVFAASINAADRVLMRGDPFLVRLFGMGVFKPKHAVLGFDVAGRVEAVGKGVEAFRPGDEVFGACRFGGFAEYASVAEATLVSKPADASFEQAAAVPTAGYTALQGLRDKGRIRSGQKVLVDGASGGVGTFAVQIAKSFGAEVTAVCSTRNVEIVRSLGADHVIDYTRDDFTRSGARYDLILAANAYRPLSDYRRALEPTGTYVMTGGGGIQILQAMLLGPWISMFTGKKMGNVMATAKKADLAFLEELLEAGKIAPVIDRSYALSEVPDAIRYIEREHARGKVVVTCRSSARGNHESAADIGSGRDRAERDMAGPDITEER
jgi:NADPH:quinone reductase-like Zn-dependent oxidoreductase